MTKYRASIRISVFLLSCFAQTLMAANYAWVIGGGPALYDSQSQIELNVMWASSVIREKSADPHIKIFYTDGSDPAPDIVNYVNFTQDNSNYLPFSYLFDGTEITAKEIYSHSIKNVSGSTRLQELVPALEQDFKKLEPTDTALILYNGHGWAGGADENMNNLRLWGPSMLTVYDFEKLISNINPETPLRFIMTQCFSGAFGNAIYEDSNKTRLTLKGRRCGFMAESATREAEGCSASLKVADYRDYTTYFFAALSGQTRMGLPLKSNPDSNGDNVVTLYEAHLYTLANAYSNDLSRSTSEQHLENWEPWYLRWLPDSEGRGQSVYSRIADEVAENNGINKMLLSDAKLFRKYRKELLDKYNVLKEQERVLKESIKQLQDKIRKPLLSKHPDIEKAYKNNFQGYDGETIKKVKTIITNNEEYKLLVNLFSQKEALTLPLLDTERYLTQVEKIYRMLNLERIDKYFHAFASEKEIDDYNSILSCENTVL